MTPDEAAVCTCLGPYPMGFSYRAELDLWVHGECGRPTRLYLDTTYARLEAEATRPEHLTD